MWSLRMREPIPTSSPRTALLKKERRWSTRTEDSLEVRERLVVNKAIDGYTLDENDPVGFTTGDAVRLAGVPAPLTIRIENPTSTALTEVRFTDTLPDGMVVAQQPNVQTDCADATVTSPAAAREIRMTGASWRRAVIRVPSAV